MVIKIRKTKHFLRLIHGDLTDRFYDLCAVTGKYGLGSLGAGEKILGAGSSGHQGTGAASQRGFARMVDLQVNTLVLKVEACNLRRTSSNLSLTGGGTPKRMPTVNFFYDILRKRNRFVGLVHLQRTIYMALLYYKYLSLKCNEYY